MKTIAYSALASVIFISLLIFIYQSAIRRLPPKPTVSYLNINPISRLANHPQTLRYHNPKYGLSFRYPDTFNPVKPVSTASLGIDIDELISNPNKKADDTALIKIIYDPVNCEEFYRQKLIGSKELVKLHPYYQTAENGQINKTRYIQTQSERNGEQYLNYIFEHGNFCPLVTISLGKNVTSKFDAIGSLLLDTVEFAANHNSESEFVEYQNKDLPFELNIPSGYQSAPQISDADNLVIQIGSTASASSLFIIQKIPYTQELTELIEALGRESVFKNPSALIDSPPIPINLNNKPAYLWIKNENNTYFTYKNYAYNIKFINLRAPFIYKILESLKFK